MPRHASGTQFTGIADGVGPKWDLQFVDGYRFIMANRMFRTLWFFTTFTGLCFLAGTATFVLCLVTQAGLPPALYGTFLLTGAEGAVLGSLFAGWFKAQLGAGTAMALANLISCVALLFVGLVPTIWGAAIGFLLTSFTVLVWNVLIMTLRQSITPGAMLGRVHGTCRTLLWGTMPLGSVTGGLLARINLALPLEVAGGAGALAALVFLRFLRTLPNAEDVDNGDRPEPEIDPAGLPLED